MWNILRAHRLSGLKFTRQVPIGPYIVDFAAWSRKLVMEVDGDTHADQVAYDAARTAFLSTQGYRVLRFANADVMRNAEGVYQVIADALLTAPLPSPLPGREREQPEVLSPWGRGLGEGSTPGPENGRPQ